ncbi:hypothetical protein EMA8858_00421 [Emticicia aquatica]|jgi:hypothetical protein|uniref:Outer membrane protein beta-barrel domain-containing protein n=2 Tax=Emticicia aquatica TaxID=1681835 RepID=A0ABN8ETU2_9BACT|nr:hypothetical protein EMA8858_00421 [Emticicia aquatica]
MKSVFLPFMLLLSICSNSLAQEIEEYYKPPSQREDVKNNVYPNLNRKSVSLYAGLEGGFKLNYAGLDGSLGNLLGTQNNNEFFWGVTLGYNLDNKWAVETGYLKNPVYYVQTIASGRGFPFTFRIGADLQTIPVRFKYKVLSLDAITKTASLYIGGGVLIGTNANNKSVFTRKFEGFTGNPSRRDSIKLTTDSFLTKKGRAAFELQTELQGRVTNGFYISLFGRMNFAPQGVLRSDLTYFQNSTKIDEASQYLKGISYNFGLLLRFDLAKGYKYKSEVE